MGELKWNENECLNSKLFQDYAQKNHRLLEQPIMKLYLSDPKRYKLLANSLCFSTEENKQILDEDFKQFYYQIKLVKYISNLIYYHTIDLEKKYKRFYQRNSLVLDQPLSLHESLTTLLDVSPSSKSELIDLIEFNYNIFQHVENPNLFKALKKNYQLSN